ncbi:iron-containing alcohol dehydrogenase [Thermogutta sp.]|uniref:iron-containing alcohol dehydrogenase n=1 Tax=Thermogutta sp. TaxID=1962930 RepID=UPI003C7C7E78
MTSFAVPLQPYHFVTPRKIIFGWGCRQHLAEELPRWGRRVFVVCGSRTLEKQGLLDELRWLVEKAGIIWQFLTTISREPLVCDVDGVTRQLQAIGVRPGDLLLAIGGGSAIDLAKAVAAMATNSQGDSVQDYLENVGRGLKLTQPPLPVAAVPTTAGTGTEATRNAVISSLDPPFKKSLRDDRVMPLVAVVDPELTVTQPPSVTATCGMDAITQLVESFISNRRKPIPQLLAPEGLRLALKWLATAYRDPDHREAREAMAHAALLSGICLANGGLGMAHGIAAALGVVAGIPHGLACAMLLPAALRTNRSAVGHELAYLGRYALDKDFPNDDAAVDALIEAVEQLRADLRLPQKLREIGVSQEMIPKIAAGSFGTSMSGNPRLVSQKEVEDILRNLY